VVVATGYEHTRFIPEWPGKDSFTGELLHSSTCRQPNPFAGQASIGGRRWLVRIEIVVLEKQEYRDPGEHARPECRLTAAGFDLCVVLGALQLWGDTYLQLPGGPVTAPANATPVTRRRGIHRRLRVTNRPASGQARRARFRQRRPG
jgi:hypothetical protein